jgi:hypothetical protein
MAQLVAATETPFTPSTGDFKITVIGGYATLQCADDSSTFAAAGGTQVPPGNWVVTQTVDGADWKFSAPAGVTVRADQ